MQSRPSSFDVVLRSLKALLDQKMAQAAMFLSSGVSSSIPRKRDVTAATEEGVYQWGSLLRVAIDERGNFFFFFFF